MEQPVRGVQGVRAVTITDDRERADVIADDDVPVPVLVDAVRRLGYEAHAVEP